MGHPRKHTIRGRSMGKTAELDEAAEAMRLAEAQAVVQRWRRMFDGLCYRMTVAPLVPMLLSERLLLAGPRAHGDFPDRREQLMASARGPARVAVARMVAERELERLEAEAAAEREEAEREARVAALLDDGTGAKAGELLLPGVSHGR